MRLFVNLNLMNKFSTLFLFGLASAASAHANDRDACPEQPAAMASAQVAQINASLDARIGNDMQKWKLPGLAIAVVKNGTPVYVKGFGVRSLEKGGAVNDQTLFGMMSTTKAMTALALAMLVDEGKVDWNDPVTKYLPWFELSDPYVTSQLKVHDLLTHNSGLGNTDLLWARGDLDSEQILRRLKNEPLSYSLRDGFAYQNVMYQVAGEIIENASGMSWADFVQQRIMQPLGMSRSRPTLDAMLKMRDENVSTAYFEIDDSLHAIKESPVDAIPAAGAAWSTAGDTAKWLDFLLNDGCVDGRRLVSSANFNLLLKPQVMVPKAEFYPTAKLTSPHWTSYGYGWFQQDYRGKFVAMHTGSMDGRTAIIGLMPDENLGVYIFGNLDHAEYRHALMWQVLDAYTGAPFRDWSTEFLALYGGLSEDGKKAEAEYAAKRVKDTKPSLELSAYAGTYRHPVYGDIDIKLKDYKLQFAMGPLPDNAGTLKHWHYDTFRVRLGDGRYGWVNVVFRIDGDASVSAVRIFDDSTDAMEFKRVLPTGKSGAP
jgi:CubicO group peptidase (beta-lactamase class C family)